MLILMADRTKSYRLILAITVFVFLDFGSLALNFLITSYVEANATAINLAGRQRMLSQRITKATLLATNPSVSSIQQSEAAAEAGQAYKTFQSTLSAFANGGETIGSDGNTVMLNPLTGKSAYQVWNVRGLLNEWPSVPAPGPRMAEFSKFMVDHNVVILEAMNELTTELQYKAEKEVLVLRVAQIVAFCMSLCNFIMILIMMQRAKLRADINSITDALTGLHNRGGIYKVLSRELKAHSLPGSLLGVILIDLDGFKAVNDTYGHAAGDETLIETSRRLKRWSKPGWSCGRLGGDEFVVICPDISADKLSVAAKELAQVMSGLPGGEHIISASVGWAIAENGEGVMDADELLGKADSAMYAEKSRRKAPLAVRGEPR